MSCCKTYDPCLDGKLNQIGSYASVARQSAEASSASATSAAASAAAAAASAEAARFYLGSFSVAPTTDNEGGPLEEGMLYYNTVSNGLFVWNGSAWASADFNEFTNFAATGTTFARNLVTRYADVINVKDFGAVGDGVTDDTAAIQAAIDVQKGPVFLPNGIYLVSSEIVIKDGTGIIGENPFWKRRTGYVYTGDKNTVIKYVGAGGTNSCVIRASKKAVGVPGSDFSPPDTDDLINIQLQSFHIDSNNIAEYGCYIYRAGNCGNVIDKITCEKSKKANHVHLGCYAAKFGVFGAYQSEDHGVVCGWDIFSWNTVEATNFAYSAHFLTANNGTSGTYPADDVSNSGGRFSVGRGSNVTITSEGNNGRACILSQYNMANVAGGTSDYYLDYIEGNADGPYIDYRDAMDGIYIRGGFFHSRKRNYSFTTKYKN